MIHSLAITQAVRRVALVAAIILSGSAAAAEGATDVRSGAFQFESVNAHSQGSTYHVLKAIYTGTRDFHGYLALQSMRCEMEAREDIKTSGDPARRHLPESMRKLPETSAGQLVFGGSMLNVWTAKPGAWFLWRMVRVPRDVAKCQMEVIICGHGGETPGNCDSAPTITLTSVSQKAQWQPQLPLRIESSSYLVHDLHEGDFFLRLQELTNLGATELMVQPLRNISAEGCELQPAKFAPTDTMRSFNDLMVLAPGTHMFHLSAAKVAKVKASKCAVHSAFSQTWRNRSGAPTRTDRTNASGVLDLLGTSLSYSEVAPDIEYQ
ncbi:MAG: hypothetical protein ACJ8R9_03730 [Steroidobacteraceae bacterium]